MRVHIVGATGNAGTSLIRALEHEPAVDEVIGMARRIPDHDWSKTRWVSADVRSTDLVPLFRGADAVVHLAWAIQPSRDLEALYATNVVGTIRVFRAAVEAKVPALVYASSIGAYSPGSKEHPIDESWPTGGIDTSFYSRHKSETERILDGYEEENPGMRVVRLRPALIFKKDAASEQRRLFGGPFLPGMLMRPDLIPIVPNIERLRFQCVHSYDVGEAYRLAIVSDVRGAFNIATDPVLDPDRLAGLLGARKIKLPESVVRALFAATWKARLQPTPPGWIDLGFQSPLMATSRAEKELGWEPRYSAEETLLDLLEGMRERAGAPTPSLAPKAGGRARIKEFLTGIGSREGVRPHA